MMLPLIDSANCVGAGSCKLVPLDPPPGMTGMTSVAGDTDIKGHTWHQIHTCTVHNNRVPLLFPFPLETHRPLCQIQVKLSTNLSPYAPGG